MPLSALALVLAAAVAHAAWNIIAHGAGRSGLPWLWWGAVFSAVLWIPAIPFTGGLGTADAPSLILGIGFSGVLHLLYMVVLLRGYSRGDLSTVYATARGVGPMLTVVAAVVLLGERPSPLALFGVALVIAGVLTFGLIARRPATARRGRGVDPAIVYGVLTGVAIAGYTVWDANAVNGFGIAPVAFMVGTCVVQVPLYTLAMLLDRRRGAGLLSGFAGLVPELRAAWPRLLAFGVLSPLSYILVLTAVTFAPVALVAPMREVSVVMVGLYAVLRFKEPRPVPRLLAAVVVTAGVILIGL